MGIQVCRLPAPSNVDLACFILQPTATPRHTSMASCGHSCSLKPSKPLKTVKPLKRWLGMLHLAANSHPAPHINGFLWAPQGHTSMASYGRPSLPFARPKTLQTLQTLKTLQTLNNRKTLPFASPQTLQTLKTLQALQTLKTLQTLKNRKTLKTLTWHASSCSQQPPRATHQWLHMAILAANRHPRATHQWLLMGVQVCRLPALKRSKPSKRLKPSKPLTTVKPCRLPALKPSNTHPRATHQWLLMGVHVAVCQP